MRLATFLAAALVLLVPGTALAHLTHSPCFSSTTVVNARLPVDLYRATCTGATVSLTNSFCFGG